MEEFPARILLSTDGSEDASLAARAAADLAEKGGSELHVVHVWHDVPTSRLHSFVRTQLMREAQEVLDRQVEQIEAAGGKVTKAHLREGRTVNEVLDLSEELNVGLLVVGGRGLGLMRRLLLGSVSEGIVHHARRPVLVVRGGQNAWPPSRVVIGDDSSAEAGELAARIAGLFGVRALLVGVFPKRLEDAGAADDSAARSVDEVMRELEAELEGRAERLGGILGQRPRISIKTSDDPALAILEVAQEEEPTLIATTAGGSGGLQHTKLGSVSTKVVRAATGPVLVYRPPRSEASQP